MAPVLAEVILVYHLGADIQMSAGSAHGRRTIALRTELFTYAAEALGRYPVGAPAGTAPHFEIRAPPPVPPANERADQWGTGFRLPGIEPRPSAARSSF